MWTTVKTARCFYLLGNATRYEALPVDQTWRECKMKGFYLLSLTVRLPLRRQHSAVICALTPLVWICFTPLNVSDWLDPTVHLGFIKNIIDMFATMRSPFFLWPPMQDHDSCDQDTKEATLNQKGFCFNHLTLSFLHSGLQVVYNAPVFGSAPIFSFTNEW